MMFNINDLVHYTNEYGVYWGIRRIVGIDEVSPHMQRVGVIHDDGTISHHHELRPGEIRYFIEPTQTPWYSHSGEEFRVVSNLDISRLLTTRN